MRGCCNPHLIQQPHLFEKHLRCAVLNAVLRARSEGDRLSGLIADVLGSTIVVSSSSAFIEK